MKNNRFIKTLLIMVFVFVGISDVKASSVSMKSSSSTITKENTATITTTVNADSGIYTIEGSMSCKGAGVDGGISLTYEDMNTSSKSKSFTYTIKPTSTGTITCSTSNVMLRELAKDSNYSIGSTSITISVKDAVVVPPKEYSSNNNLSSLSVDGYDLDKKFDKDTLEYSLEVPNGTEKVKINATTADKNASIKGAGEVEVSEGNNKLEVKVTAENGNVKTYVINLTVKELDPIEVTVDNKKYSIIRKEGILEAPENYEKSSIKIGDDDVLCYKNEVTNNIIIGLKDEDGNSKFYSYDEKKNEYTLYNGYKIGGLSLNILSMPSNILPSGYSKVYFKYNENKIEGYQYIDKNVTYAATDDTVSGNDFYLIYAINEVTGDKGLYVYDKLEGTVQRYNEASQISKIEQEKDNYKLYFIITLIVFLVSIISTIITILVKKKKGNKRVKSKVQSNINF